MTARVVFAIALVGYGAFAIGAVGVLGFGWWSE